MGSITLETSNFNDFCHEKNTNVGELDPPPYKTYIYTVSFSINRTSSKNNLNLDLCHVLPTCPDMAGWSWGTAWGDDALDEQEEEAEGRVLDVAIYRYD